MYCTCITLQDFGLHCMNDLRTACKLGFLVNDGRGKDESLAI
jgi:hypothetical protein